jgi:hypothetical protein
MGTSGTEGPLLAGLGSHGPHQATDFRSVGPGRCRRSRDPATSRVNQHWSATSVGDACYLPWLCQVSAEQLGSWHDVGA